MKKVSFLLFLALMFSVNVFAHEAFKLISNTKKTVRSDQLSQLEKEATIGKIANQNLTFSEKEISLIALTGPSDDMLSYRIQGLRNPNLLLPSGATLKILFINSDEDMRHDIRFGHITAEFETAPDIAETAGSNKLEPKSADIWQAEEIVIQATEDGQHKYFCSVRGHARDGMWGNILVGTSNTENLKMPEKKPHVHSPDEDHKKTPDKKMSIKTIRKKMLTQITT